MGDIRDIESHKDLSKRIQFRDDENVDMICYTKDGRYENNRLGTHLRFFNLHSEIKSPGGPNRFFYLMKRPEREVVDPSKGIGVIAHNGEKVQESLPNVAVAYFSGEDLLAYKLFCDREFHEHRAGKYLTPILQNSIYNDGMIVNRGLKLYHLNNHEYPSQFRDTTVIIPKANDAAYT